MYAAQSTYTNQYVAAISPYGLWALPSALYYCMLHVDVEDASVSMPANLDPSLLLP